MESNLNWGRPSVDGRPSVLEPFFAINAKIENIV